MENIRPAALMAAHGAILLKMADVFFDGLPHITQFAVAMTSLCATLGLIFAYGVFRISRHGEKIEQTATKALLLASEFIFAVIAGMWLFGLFGIEMGAYF